MNHKKGKLFLTAFVSGILVTLLILLLVWKPDSKKDTLVPPTDYMGNVVLDGFSIPIPNKYMAVTDKNVGLSYMDSDTFEMGITVESANYEATVLDLASLDNSIRSWAKLMQPFTEIAVGGQAYIYCVYEDEGECILLAYKEADKEHVFQIMVRCLNIDQMKYQSEAELVRTYESYIIIANSLLSGAKTTDEENTPSGTVFLADEMYSDLKVVLPETFIPEDILYTADGKELVSYQVEKNFYKIASKTGNYSTNIYLDTDRHIETTIIVDDCPSDGNSAKQLMQNGAAFWSDSKTAVQCTEIDGISFYYYSYSETYSSMDTPLKKYYFEAAADLKSGQIYRISASSEVSPDVLDIETFHKFLTITQP